MPVSTVTISEESIVRLAQNTFVQNSAVAGLRCEWGSGKDVCNVVAACWESLKQHYNQHLRAPDVKSKKEKHVLCRLPRCSGPIQTSVEALKHHIETSHLSRTTISCPIQDCRPSAVLRSSTIVKHFLDEHFNLNGTVVELPSAILRPSWRPFYPSAAMPLPPPLPSNPDPGCVLIASTPCPKRNRRPSLISAPLTPTPSSTPSASPRKQPQRQIPKEKPDEEDETELSIPNFAPLPGYPESASHRPQDLIVWRRPTVFEMDVARPLAMHNGPIRETSISILYDVFAKHVDELERKGLLS